MAKRKWLRPVLTVIIRGLSQERVLYICKEDISGSGPGRAFNYCFADKNPGCQGCDRARGS